MPTAHQEQLIRCIRTNYENEPELIIQRYSAEELMEQIDCCEQFIRTYSDPNHRWPDKWDRRYMSFDEYRQSNLFSSFDEHENIISSLYNKDVHLRGNALFLACECDNTKAIEAIIGVLNTEQKIALMVENYSYIDAAMSNKSSNPVKKILEIIGLLNIRTDVAEKILDYTLQSTINHGKIDLIAYVLVSYVVAIKQDGKNMVADGQDAVTDGKDIVATRLANNPSMQLSLIELVRSHAAETLEKVINALGNKLATIMVMTAPYNNGYTALHAAVESADPKKIQALIQLLDQTQITSLATLGVGKNKRDTLLYMAIRKNPDFALELLKILDINNPTATTVLYSALKLATEYGRAEIIKRIIDKIGEEELINKAADDKELATKGSPLNLAVEFLRPDALTATLAALGRIAATMANIPPLCSKKNIAPPQTPFHLAVERMIYAKTEENKSKVKAMIAVLGIDAEKQLANKDYHFNQTQKDFAQSYIRDFIEKELFLKLLAKEPLSEKQIELCIEYQGTLILALREKCAQEPSNAATLLSTALDPETQLGKILHKQKALTKSFDPSIVSQARKNLIKRILLEKREIPLPEQKKLFAGDEYKEAQKEIQFEQCDRDTTTLHHSIEALQSVIDIQTPERAALFTQCGRDLETLRNDIKILESALDPETPLGKIFVPRTTQVTLNATSVVATTTITDEISTKISALQIQLDDAERKIARTSIEDDLLPKLLDKKPLNDEQMALCRKYREILIQALWQQCTENRDESVATTIQLPFSAIDPETQLGEILGEQINLLNKTFGQVVVDETRKDFLTKELLPKLLEGETLPEKQMALYRKYGEVLKEQHGYSTKMLEQALKTPGGHDNSATTNTMVSITVDRDTDMQKKALESSTEENLKL